MPLPENLLAPITADNPCGEPASAANWYPKLRELRRPNEAAVNAFLAPQPATDRRPRIITRDIWAPREPGKLIDSLTSHLASNSKDLELAAWLTEALAWRDGFTGSSDVPILQSGFAGLAEGLKLMHDLLDTFWEHLHPLPDEGDYYLRVKHLQWVGMSDRDACVTAALGFINVTWNKMAKTGLSFNQYQESRGLPGREASGEADQTTRREGQAAGKILPEDFDAAIAATKKTFYKDLKAQVTASRDALTALEDLCAQKFGPKDGPGFTNLKEKLEKAENVVDILLRQKLEKEPDEVIPPPPPNIEGPQDPDLPSPPPSTEVTGIAPASKQEAVLRTAAVARYLRRAEPGSPVPFLLLRSLRWGELYGAGEIVSEALLAAPPAEVRRQLKSLAAAGQWAQVLELAESSMAADYGLGWLDLHRYSVKACEALGYEHAARAIKCAVLHLLADYPKLAKSTLRDDTGAANPDTLRWFEDIRE